MTKIGSVGGASDLEMQRNRRIVEEAVQNPTLFVRDSLSDTGDCVNRVAVRSNGEVRVLHSWWQSERIIDHLSDSECRDLAVAGFRIQQDRDDAGDCYVYLRHKKHQHLWVAYTFKGWGFSRAVNLKDCRWESLAPSHQALPVWEGWGGGIRGSVRESAAVAVQALRYMGYPNPVIPDKVLSDAFFVGLRALAEDVVAALEEDAGRMAEFLDQLPVETREQYEVESISISMQG